jgi:putative methionine-R-sulfoxide reductase with GAF domain
VREVQNYTSPARSTRSELVVLIRDAGRIVGEFDIGSDTVGALIQEDEALLDEMAVLTSGRRVASLAASYEAS